MEKESTNNAIGFGCIMLFLSVFLVAGLGALGIGVKTLIENDGFTEESIPLFGVGGLFALVGGLFIGALISGRRGVTDMERRKEQEPGRPWLWQEDWAEGRVKSSTPVAMLIFWFFGLAFGGAGTLILFNLDEIANDGPQGYAALLVPLLGYALLTGAIYTTLRWLKYGRPYCDLVANPGVVGGWFRAVVWAKVKLAPEDVIEAQLTCFHCYTTGSGKSRTSHRKVTWQESRTLSQEYMSLQADGTLAIPFKVYVPRDCKPTTPEHPSNRFEWELSTKAAVTGIDFAAAFIVPVFVTDESSDDPPLDSAADTSKTTLPTYLPTIIVSEGVDSLELYAPPRRNLGVAFGITFFTFFWAVIVAILFHDDKAPVILLISFGLTDLFFMGITLWLWFGKVRVRLDHKTAHINKTILGVGSRSRMALRDITGVTSRINMQSGKTPYYAVRLITTAGNRTIIGSIKNKAEANALVQQIERWVLNAT